MESVLESRGDLDIPTIQLVLNHISSSYEDQQQSDVMSSQILQSPVSTTSTTSVASSLNDSDGNEDNDSENEDDDDEVNTDNENNEDNNNRNKIKPTKSSLSPPIVSPSPSPLNQQSAASWLDPLSVAISSDATLMVVGGGGSGGVGTGLAIVLTKRQDQWKTSMTLDHQSGQVDKITAISILTLSSNPQLEQAIAIGYTSGHLRIFSLSGNLLLAQLFHRAPILKIKVKMTAIVTSSQERYSMQEVSILYPDNVVASMSGQSLSSVLSVCYQQVLRGDTTSASQTKLDFRKWSLGSIEKANDFSFAGPFLGSPFRALPYGTSEHPMTRMVVAGRDPMLAYYYPSDDSSSSFTVAVALVSSVAAKLTNAVYSFAKSWWGSSSNNNSNQQQSQQSQQEATKIENPSPLHIRWSMIDEKRELKSILMDPSGRYAAVTDNLGRVLLIDIVNSLVIRMWKGYRDCQCGWITSLSSDEEEEEEEEKEESKQNDTENNNNSDDIMTLEDFIPTKMMRKKSADEHYRTYLAIYIGRRGYLEVWGMKHKSRVVFEKVGMGCRLLSTSVPGKRLPVHQGQTQLSTPKNYQSRTYLINKDGNLNEIVVHK